jgi:two-component system LytT family sensor kinase
MPSPLPIKSLIRLNWLLVFTFTAIISLYFIFLLDEIPIYKVFYMGMTALGIGSVAFVNVRILILLVRTYSVKGKAFRRYRYFFTYAASAIIYLMLAPAFDYFEHKGKLYPFPVFLVIFFVSSVLVNTVIIMLQDFVILQAGKAHADLELSQIKAAHAEATNLLLKQQIHPHFLFNALNTLKALYRKDPGAGDNYIVHLANFLRASVYNHAAKTSSLADELALLLDYLEMQKIRFGSALNCIIDLPFDILNDRYLPSFSLQPLLENALKHNELTQQSPLVINIFCSEDRIVVSNTLKKKNLNVTSTHHGLANLAERYSLLSGDEVIISENKDTFSVSIKLLNNEYSDHRG